MNGELLLVFFSWLEIKKWSRGKTISYCTDIDDDSDYDDYDVSGGGNSDDDDDGGGDDDDEGGDDDDYYDDVHTHDCFYLK